MRAHAWKERTSGNGCRRDHGNFYGEDRMMDLVAGTLLLIAFGAQMVALVVTFGGGNRDTEVPADRLGGR
jgi:hypothetical protein